MNTVRHEGALAVVGLQNLDGVRDGVRRLLVLRRGRLELRLLLGAQVRRLLHAGVDLRDLHVQGLDLLRQLRFSGLSLLDAHAVHVDLYSKARWMYNDASIAPKIIAFVL